MHVVATAGHVDHGKSTLVRALTGMEPDRWAEERRRGMTIDLGFAWCRLPSGETVAFVDVPGHERFVPNMLAGAGPVPAVMIVVAADEGWMPQSEEHLAALHALGVRHGLLVVTRSDLADPEPARAGALSRIATTTLGTVEAVTVSGRTGAGLDTLRTALDRLTGTLPPPDSTAPVRLWIDRAFTIRGAGTVVTGTLGAGTLHTGDELELTGAPGPVRIRGLQMLGEPAETAGAVARVAVNLRNVGRDTVTRGAALLTPGRFRLTTLIDVRFHGDLETAAPEPAAALPATITLHTGSAAVPVRVRPLGPDTARLRLDRPLPLRIGDRALLRDPGRHHVAGGVTVLDADPPALNRRGAAARRAAVLTGMTGTPDLAGELRRRLLARGADLWRHGVPAEGRPVAGDWFADPDHWTALGERLAAETARHAAEHPLEPGVPLEVLRQRLGLPDRALVEALVRPPLTVAGGRVTDGGPRVPEEVVTAVRRAFEGLADQPFTAPEADRLTEVGLGTRQIGAAVRAGLVVRLGVTVLLPPGAPDRAVAILAGIPQPFTLSEARRALGTSRRVAVPLLELLDRSGVTERLPGDLRTVAAVDGPSPG